MASMTPGEIISRYIDRNTINVSGTVTVRGIYIRVDNDDSQKQWAFDKLKDEKSNSTLKVLVSKDVRDYITTGETVELSGTLSDYGFQESGTLQVQLRVSGVEKAKEIFVTKAENDRHMVRRTKATKGYKDVRRILSELIKSGQHPNVAMIYPSQTVADTDFERAIGDAFTCYTFQYLNVPFSDSAGVVRTLKGCDREYDLVCIVRGGGSGLQNLDDIDILTQVAAMETPVLTAIGHAEDNQFIDTVADLSKETPSLLGTFFKEIVQEKLYYARVLKEKDERYEKLRKALIGVVAVLAVIFCALVYLVIKR